jgi:hypothetical protein
VTCLLSQMTPADKVFMLHVEDKFGYKVMQLAIQLSDIRLTISLYHFFCCRLSRKCSDLATVAFLSTARTVATSWA